jgi:hypothetical protein
VRISRPSSASLRRAVLCRSALRDVVNFVAPDATIGGKRSWGEIFRYGLCIHTELT